jgi:hypothetical protein
MKSIPFFLLLFLTMALSLQTKGQDFIVLKKNIQSYRYYTVGSEMELKLDGENFWLRTRIDSIAEKHIVLNGSLIEINSITKLKIRRQNMNYYSNGTILMVAGSVFPLILATNISLEDNYHPNPRPFISSAALIIGGFYIRKKQYKNVKINNKKYRLRAFVQ